MLWSTTSAHFCFKILALQFWFLSLSKIGMSVENWHYQTNSNTSAIKLTDECRDIHLIKHWIGKSFLTVMTDSFMDIVFVGSLGDFSDYCQISGFRYPVESSKNGVWMHFECDFSPFWTQTLTWPHPLDGVLKIVKCFELLLGLVLNKNDLLLLLMFLLNLWKKAGGLSTG